MHDHVRARGVADLVFFSLEYPALYCDPASQVFADGLRFARKRFATHMLMHECLYATEKRSYRASSSVSVTQSPTQSLLKKTQGPRLMTYAALNCFIMTFYDVEHP